MATDFSYGSIRNLDRSSRAPSLAGLNQVDKMAAVKAPLLYVCCALLAPLMVSAEETSSTPKEQFERRLSQIIIPKLDFRDATLRETIDFLKKKSVELGPTGFHGPAYPLIVEDLPQFGPRSPDDGDAGKHGDPLPSSGERRITVLLTNIPMSEALRYVTGLANMRLSFRKDGVHVVDVSDPEPMFSREFRIPADFFPAFAREDQLGHTDHVAEMKQDFAAYLVSNGLIELPNAASITLNHEATRLWAHTTDDQLDAIQKLLDTDRPEAAFPVPGPEVHKVIAGWPREGATNWESLETDIAKKLRTTRLPKIAFREFAPHEVTALLSKLSREHGGPGIGVERGFRIDMPLFVESVYPPERISYSATNVSLLEALEAIGRLYKCRTEIKERGVEWKWPTGVLFYTYTYLVPPSSAAQMAKGPALIEPNTPLPWINGGKVNGPTHGVGQYIAKRHCLVVQETVEELRVVQQANEMAWRDYYALRMKQTRKSR